MFINFNTTNGAPVRAESQYRHRRFLLLSCSIAIAIHGLAIGGQIRSFPHAAHGNTAYYTYQCNTYCYAVFVHQAEQAPPIDGQKRLFNTATAYYAYYAVLQNTAYLPT